MEKQPVESGDSTEVALAKTVLGHIQEHIAEWKNDLLTYLNVSLTRLSGLSNACYRVRIEPDSTSDP